MKIKEKKKLQNTFNRQSNTLPESQMDAKVIWCSFFFNINVIFMIPVTLYKINLKLLVFYTAMGKEQFSAGTIKTVIK